MRRAAEITERRKDEIIEWLIRESGGTALKCGIEWSIVRDGFWEAAGMPHHVDGRILPSDIPHKESRVYRQPIGVIAVISPWDFPIYLTNRTVAPALAVGNALVLKPASDTPVTGGLLLAKILEEAGLPAGVMSVIVGSGELIGTAMATHATPRLISFTGSTEVGIAISRAAGIKKLVMELGGNAPMVILDDADLDYAAEAAAFGSFFNSGQICMSANRLIVDDSVYDEFVAKFLARVASLRVGDPADPETFIGPLISKKQLDGVRAKVARSIEDGAELLAGGEPFGPSGLTLPPHVLAGTNLVTSAREEMFGPVITIVRAADETDALRIANDTEYGLSSSVITGDRERGTQFALQLDAGMSHVNDSPVNEEDNTAYGGVKQSGLGRFGGNWSIDEFTTDHWISVQAERRVYFG